MQGNAETAGQAVQDEAQQAQAIPQRAIERIPQKGVTMDEDGNKMPEYDWEKAKPEDTYDALKDEIFGEDEKQTADSINATIREIESEGKAKQEQLDKISGGDVASAVRNAAKRKALKAELDELRKRVDYWRSVLAVPAQRAKAEQEKVAGSEIQPVGTGDFGPIYDQFKGKPKEAVKFLMSKKEVNVSFRRMISCPISSMCQKVG